MVVIKSLLNRLIARYSVTRCNWRRSRNVARTTLAEPRTQLVSFSQFHEPDYIRLADRLDIGKRIHRKYWEWVYILRSLEYHGMLAPGRSGIGFGCGNEPMPRVLAASGVRVLATDLPDGEAAARGWETMELQSGDDNIRTTHLDMNAIDDRYLRGEFDFAWSSCSLEHLGTMKKGMDFVLNSLQCLKPGGIAVHTTEFNLSSDLFTVRSGPTVLFRERDITTLRDLVHRHGGAMSLALGPGERMTMDTVDYAPYDKDPHVQIMLGGVLVTSIGMTIRKNS